MFNLVIGFLNDVILIAGTALTTAMMVTGVVQWPSKPVILYTLIMGLVQATRRLQSKTGPSPIKEEAPVRTPEQLAAQIKARDDTIVALVERVAKTVIPASPASPPSATPPPPITPLRVETPPAPPAVIVDPGVTRIPRERDLPGGSP